MNYLIRKNGLGENAVLNATKSALSVLFPLITYPYALRILGAVNIGKVSYVNSIVSYFAIIAALGVATYGVREGAKLKEHRAAFENFVGEVFTINVISTLITYVVLALFFFLVFRESEYGLLMAILSLSIVLTTLGVDWINTVFEDFIFITVRSIIVHIVSMILLFVLVKKTDDYYIYAGLQIFPTAIICISNWFYCKKYVKIRFRRPINAKLHLKPLLIMLAGSITISLYVNSDVTMLGIFSGDYSVGIYTASTKIYSVIKNILSAVYAVTVPTLSVCVGNKAWNKYKELYSNIFGGISILLLPAVTGMFLLSNEIMLVMGGDEYASAVTSLRILSIALLFAIYGGLVTACLNITLGREKDNLVATVYSAFINIGLNFVFIPEFSINGAAFTTLIAEAFVFLYCIIKNQDRKKYIDYLFLRREIRNAIIGCVGMSAVVLLIKYLINGVFQRVAVSVVVGGFLYFVIEYALRDAIVLKYINSFLNKVFLRKKLWDKKQ